MAALQETQAPAWSIRLAFELIGNDQTANALVAGLTDERLNSQPAPGCWSMGQCLEHVTNEVYMPPISAALEEKPDSPVEQITSGWFGRWFIRSFAEASPNGKRASPRARSGLGRVSSFRFLIDSSPAANLGANSASEPPQEHEPHRFWNPLIPGMVGTGLETIASRERRHLLQAERVRDSASFPH